MFGPQLQLALPCGASLDIVGCNWGKGVLYKSSVPSANMAKELMTLQVTQSQAKSSHTCMHTMALSLLMRTTNIDKNLL